MKRIFVLLVVTIIGMTQSVKSQNVAVFNTRINSRNIRLTCPLS